MMDVRDIYDLYEERKKRLSTSHQAALKVQQAYYGEIVLPLPEIDRAERPLVANLIFSGGEQRAMRVASTMPDVRYPSATPGQPLADKKARHRRLVNLSWWDDDLMALKLRKRARYIVYYAKNSVVLRPNFREQRPTWQVRNPLNTFAPELDVGELCPPDVIFTYTKSYAWLAKQYPEQAKKLNLHPDQAMSYICLEYIDDHEYVTAVIGEKYQPTSSAYGQEQNAPTSPDGEIVELERVVNRLGRTPAVITSRVGLEHARGEFDGVVGLYQAQAKLMALMVHGVQRSIYPEMWLVDNPNDPEGAQIVTHADPMRGITGRVTGGQLITIHPTPEVLASNIGNQLERAQRIESGTPAELGGESTSNVRTGKRGDAILSAVLDFPIQEEQQLLEVSMREECRLAIEIDKAYFPQSKSVFFSASAGMITYDAADFWEGLQNLWVKYAHAGVDAQGLPVEIGQRVGMGTMSKESAMEIDPLIEDPKGEVDRMNNEAMRGAMLASISAMAQDPTMAPVVARVMAKFRSADKNIEDAILEVHEVMQAEQAAAQEQAQAAAAAPMAGQQPGMAEPVAAIQPPSPSTSNLADLLSSLNRGRTAGQIPGGGMTLEGAAVR